MSLQNIAKTIPLILIFSVHLRLTESRRYIRRSHGKPRRLRIAHELDIILPPCEFCRRKEMKTLKKLHYEDNIIVNVSSDAFDCLPNLIDLYIEDCGTFPLQAGLFSQIPSLEKLRMNGESLTFHQMH